MTDLKPVHGIFLPFFAWGHTRPMLQLGLRLLQVYPQLHLTFLLTPSGRAPVEAELASPFSQLLDQPATVNGKQVAPVIERLQLLHAGDVGGNTISEAPVQFQKYAEELPAHLTSLLKGEAEVHGLPNKWKDIRPTWQIYDPFCSFAPPITAALTAELNIPLNLLCFHPTCGAALYRTYANPETYGHLERANLAAKADIAAGATPEQAYTDNMFANYGEVLHLPGIKEPHFDYEYFPQLGAVPLPPQLRMFAGSTWAPARMEIVKAFVTSQVGEYEPDAAEAVMKETGKPVIMCGLQFPELMWQGLPLPAPPSSDVDGHRVLAFLDRMLETHGPRSVFYVSSGSVFFPSKRPELHSHIHTVLLELGIPFLYANPSEFTAFDQAYMDKINAHESGTACMVKFTPQWQVLHHPAVGVFVSHCGANSTGEAIMASVPIVSIPVSADQGEYAQLLAQEGAAIDLVQVKTFERSPKTPADVKFDRLYSGEKIIGTDEAIKAEMRDVFTRMQGEEGERIRGNMRRLREIAVQSRNSGETKKAIEAFAEYF